MANLHLSKNYKTIYYILNYDETFVVSELRVLIEFYVFVG